MADGCEALRDKKGKVPEEGMAEGCEALRENMKGEGTDPKKKAAGSIYRRQ